MFNSILTEFDRTYAKDLIIECFGNEAELYAQDYRTTESFYTKYQHLIENNLQYIKDKKIIDVGSGTGVWGLLMQMNGAEHVTCVEPRRQLANGLANIINKHSLPMTSIADFHNEAIAKRVDTIILSGVLDLIPDHILYMKRLGKVCEYIIIKNGIYDIDPYSAQININHNIHHRAGFNFDSKNIPDGLGLQTNIHDIGPKPSQGQYVQYKFGSEYLKTIAKYLNYYIKKQITVDNQQYLVLNTIRDR